MFKKSYLVLAFTFALTAQAQEADPTDQMISHSTKKLLFHSESAAIRRDAFDSVQSTKSFSGKQVSAAKYFYNMEYKICDAEQTKEEHERLIAEGLREFFEQVHALKAQEKHNQKNLSAIAASMSLNDSKYNETCINIGLSNPSMHELLSEIEKASNDGAEHSGYILEGLKQLDLVKYMLELEKKTIEKLRK